MADFTYIRDEIVINSILQTRLINQSNILPGSKIRLVARKIRHDIGFVLNLPRYHVVIVALEYNSVGGSINVSAASGAAGTQGETGNPGRASLNIDNAPGSPGTVRSLILEKEKELSLTGLEMSDFSR